MTPQRLYDIQRGWLNPIEFPVGVTLKQSRGGAAIRLCGSLFNKKDLRECAVDLSIVRAILSFAILISETAPLSSYLLCAFGSFVPTRF